AADLRRGIWRREQVPVPVGSMSPAGHDVIGVAALVMADDLENGLPHLSRLTANMVEQDKAPTEQPAQPEAVEDNRQSKPQPEQAFRRCGNQRHQTIQSLARIKNG